MSALVRLMVGPEQSDNAQFGSLMRLLRDEAGLSRANAADKVSLSSEYLRLIERGQRVPAGGTMQTILEGYRVPFEIKSEDDHYVITVRGHRIEFISRIQEVRRRTNGTLPAPDRNEQIGKIVGLLTIADDRTLRNVHRALKRART